jgi:hypothetical protein
MRIWSLEKFEQKVQHGRTLHFVNQNFSSFEHLKAIATLRLIESSCHRVLPLKLKRITIYPNPLNPWLLLMIELESQS